MAWRDIYWALAHGDNGRVPSEVDRMTMAEISMLLDRPDPKKRRAPEGFQAIPPALMAEHARRLRAMTLGERMQRARQRWRAT